MNRRCRCRRDKGKLWGGVSRKQRWCVGADGRGRFGVGCAAAGGPLPFHTPACFCTHISSVTAWKVVSRAVAPLFHCFAFGTSHEHPPNGASSVTGIT